MLIRTFKAFARGEVWINTAVKCPGKNGTRGCNLKIQYAYIYAPILIPSTSKRMGTI